MSFIHRHRTHCLLPDPSENSLENSLHGIPWRDECGVTRVVASPVACHSFKDEQDDAHRCSTPSMASDMHPKKLHGKLCLCHMRATGRDFLSRPHEAAARVPAASPSSGNTVYIQGNPKSCATTLKPLPVSSAVMMIHLLLFYTRSCVLLQECMCIYIQRHIYTK